MTHNRTPVLAVARQGCGPSDLHGILSSSTFEPRCIAWRLSDLLCVSVEICHFPIQFGRPGVPRMDPHAAASLSV